jgi:hypothetical protein
MQAMTALYCEANLLILPTYEQIFTLTHRVMLRDARKERGERPHFTLQCKHAYAPNGQSCMLDVHQASH